ncbi:MAG: LD-carboxypeptidase [Lachnospiraceae bacterium]|nr:LD-carboxypeptidase [Lachnospiraceae bacterium]
MNRGDKIGIVCCSNGQKREYSRDIEGLAEVLESMGLHPVFSNYIYAREDVFGGTARERAQALMDFYRDDEIEGIFDISGGDIANGILPYLDYGVIADSRKMFWGYSDLTTVINAIYAKTGRPSVLYQVRNLIYDQGERQRRDFANTVMNHGNDLFSIDAHLIQGGKMHGIVAGGNIRCFLKLAGTEYMPDLRDKVLLLESRGGRAPQIETYLCQLEQLGAFRMVSGILLGTFTQMQAETPLLSVEGLVRKFVGKNMPIAVTSQIGHGTGARGIVIGQEITVQTG